MELTAHVFGKEGCSKCSALKRRLGDLLKREEYKDFKMEYHDVLTEDGIVDFCKASCLNPNRIPALLIADDEGYIRNPICFSESKKVFEPGCTYSWLGLQTDYDKGGVITPSMIQEVLTKAKELKNGSKTKKDLQSYLSAEAELSAGGA